MPASLAHARQDKEALRVETYRAVDATRDQAPRPRRDAVTELQVGRNRLAWAYFMVIMRDDNPPWLAIQRLTHCR
jgi:hypothetical protein